MSKRRVLVAGASGVVGRETLSIPDRAYILIEGRIDHAGSADEIVGTSKAKEIYQGESFRLKPVD